MSKLKLFHFGVCRNQAGNIRNISAGLLCMLGAAAHAAPERDVLPVPTAETMKMACIQALENARESYASIQEISMDKLTVENTLEAWDKAQAALQDIMGPVDLMANVHPDKRVRKAGEKCSEDESAFLTQLFQNRELFERIKAVKTTNEIDTVLKDHLVEQFEDTGVALTESKRNRIAEIRNQLTSLSQEFSRNIRDNKSKLEFTGSEIEGLPKDYLLRTRIKGTDTIRVGFDYPDYRPFMSNVHDEKARNRYYIAYNKRGGDRNIEILDQVVKLRKELAELFGLPSYAHFGIRRKMAEKPEAVNEFLKTVYGVVDKVQQKELEKLQFLKAVDSNKNPHDARINRWDYSYYSERYRKKEFGIDQEALRKYFPSHDSVNWAVRLSEKLYGLRFVREEVPVWHPEVQYYDVIDSQSKQRLGGVYLDLFPRDGKYKHAAAFGVRSGSKKIQRKPISVLVTNFNRNGMTHDEIETLLHEFGHVLHGVLSQTTYLYHAGTRVQRDFVEAPSQIFEEWARRREGLDVLREVCIQCPVISDDLLRRLNDARRFGQGIKYARQHLYASFDMTLASSKVESALSVWKRMEGERPMGHVDGTQFPGTFGHIVGGYAAGYYGYMWSEVLALDMLSSFGSNLMDKHVGMRFRQQVLSRGGEQPAKQLVEKFLGRPANNDAFFKEITGQRRISTADRKLESIVQQL